MEKLRWLSGEQAILASETVRRHPDLGALSRLIFNARRPLLGALTIVFDDSVLQYGRASGEAAEALTQIHRGVDPQVRYGAGSNGNGTGHDRLNPPVFESAEDYGFDLSQADLGLAIERDRRFPLPSVRDFAPGEWVHPVCRVHSPDFFMRVLGQRNLGLGEAFLHDDFEMLRGSIHHLCAFLQINEVDRKLTLSFAEQAKLVWLYAKWRWRHSHNEDIADHYDTGDNIMIPMLGATGCYSCGYMNQETDDLDQMQIAKMNLILSKMRLEPGMRILDTGCGNGGMLAHAALSWGCEGEGFTNSYNMAALARRNAERNGVSERITIHHADFSRLKEYPDEHFDAIYEVGVWEHLPFSQYKKVMNECWRILKPHGRMLLHSMAGIEAKHHRDAYIQKYIFRDSNQIRLHGLVDQARRHGMLVADVEDIGRHYYWTGWHWRQNLIEAYEHDPTISERNFRIMLYFLECGMSDSRFGDLTVYQILMFKNNRDYRYTWRVNGRNHGTESDVPAPRPFTMQPSNQNEHIHNDQYAEGKLEAKVYRRPSLWGRIGHVVDVVRNVTHR